MDHNAALHDRETHLFTELVANVPGFAGEHPLGLNYSPPDEIAICDGVTLAAVEYVAALLRANLCDLVTEPSEPPRFGLRLRPHVRIWRSSRLYDPGLTARVSIVFQPD